MATTVGDFIVSRLTEWGVTRIYGYPGDGINGILGALDRAGDRIRFIQTRHEEMAAFMACAHAKFTSEVGVCLATSGPGAIHLLNGLYDAQLDHQPVVAIVGQSARSAIGGNYQQEVDLHSLFKDVAHEYVHVASVPEQFPHLIDRAVRIALAERTVTCVIVPGDLQQMDAVKQPPNVHGTVHSSSGITYPRIVPRDEDLRRAADALNAGSKVAMLVGAGALGATDEVLEVADVLGAGIAKALLGKATVPDDYPFVTGAIGLLGTRASYDMMTGCDTLLMVGSSFPYSEFLPPPGNARGVQIDIDARMIGIRYPMEVNLVGDSGETLRALLPLLQRKSDRSWRETIERNVSDWWQLLEARAMTDANPVNPQRVFWELSSRLPDECILSADSGTTASWYARDLKFRRGMMGSCPVGWPRWGRRCLMPSPRSFVTRIECHCARRRRCDADERHQRADHHREILARMERSALDRARPEQSRSQHGHLGSSVYSPAIASSRPLRSVPDFDYAGYARMLGLGGIRVDSPDAVGRAWDMAFESDRPFVIDAITDPNVPPLPPHITLEQAKSFASSLLKGDAETLGLLKQTMKEMIAGKAK